MAHFKQIFLRKPELEYKCVDPLVSKWKPLMGYVDPKHYRGVVDLMEHTNVIWRPYESRRDLTLFRDICCYLGWIMGGRDRMCRHLPERLLRQYNYVQTIHRPPTTIRDPAPADVVMAFTNCVCPSP